MPNLRIIYDNASDRATTILSAGGFAITPYNVQTDYKSEVWRSLSLSAVALTLTWPVAEMFDAVVFAFTNMTSAATVQIRGYALSDDTVPIVNITRSPAPAGNIDSFPWGAAPLGANAYSYAGSSYGVVWLPTTVTCQKLIINFNDAANPAGYIELARLIVGKSWTPEYNAEAGASLGIIDTSKQERSDAGDMRVERGTIHKTLSFDLNFMTNTDRNQLFNILRGNGMFKPVYVNLTPESTDYMGEQMYQIYGRIANRGAIKYQMLNQFSSQIEIAEV